MLSDIFFHSVVYLSILLIVSIDGQKFLILMNSNLSVVVFLLLPVILVSFWSGLFWLQMTMQLAWAIKVLVYVKKGQSGPTSDMAGVSSDRMPSALSFCSLSADFLLASYILIPGLSRSTRCPGPSQLIILEERGENLSSGSTKTPGTDSNWLPLNQSLLTGLDGCSDWSALSQVPPWNEQGYHGMEEGAWNSKKCLTGKHSSPEGQEVHLERAFLTFLWGQWKK